MSFYHLGHALLYLVTAILKILAVFFISMVAFSFCDLLTLSRLLLVTDLIKKLINKSKQLDAVKFIYAFELVDKFPPVPLLNAYLKEAQRMAQVVRKRGNNSAQSLVCNCLQTK
eukprot:TRINITY_DN16972_c0_g2_i2.p2 TRINITY_DN16972_c0_g2~~TRINITY_DN16972_c0_g2_i2.p2  ORF type:complete len:114 (+),score=9.66 TRINITY_DN16972_c0_g2_i2:885-1226(+)